ncbi:hypothetical protein UY3_08365 [Chelonia mydas]|uniref:Uncharacterized protein n=1 Tax=Chelonia mydas TaxID=8469 RepID=M7BFZ2_CHEMY|nr:hypothetical protein UY3_08365 [Chelonia mydas]
MLEQELAWLQVEKGARDQRLMAESDQSTVVTQTRLHRCSMEPATLAAVLAVPGASCLGLPEQQQARFAPETAASSS